MAAPEFGIFLPIGNGGWIMSTTAPHPEATFDYNKRAALLAEQHGLDFIMSMAKWRGYGGETDHWGRTLESVTMMCGLAAVTTRVQVWATIHTICFHPAVAAKMLVTLDQISGGRAGMNIVIGGYPEEFSQMGLWPSHLSHDDRYRYTTEWLDVIRQLWSEDGANHDGEFFHLEDCNARPHPMVTPRLICAGMSDVGLEFTTANCDGAFIGGHDLDSLRALSDRVHHLAEDKGRSIRTYTMMTIVMDDTDEAAWRRVAHIEAGADVAAIEMLARNYARHGRADVDRIAERFKRNGGFQTERIIGSPDTVAAQLEELVTATGLDGVMLIFPDFHADLDAFGEAVMPRLRRQPVLAEAQGS
jgi:pyrimidine oxygenase